MTDPINDPLSPIRLQIMWDRLIAVVEEQALTLIRTGFSTSTREAGDLSAGVFDITGDMLAQAVTGTPGHVNSMARSVRHFLDRFPVEDMADGDVFLTNDPWKGTGHLHDFTFLTPCFRNGTLVALFASTCHVVDIGGRGMTSDGRSIYEEGLYIPLMRFAHAGKIDQAVIDIVTANVREPVQVIGDLHSLATCNDLACRRLCEMMDEFAITGLDRLGSHILERSRVASLEAIRALPTGTFRHEMRIDGLEEPVDLVAEMTIGEDGIDVDFTGSSGISSHGINVPLCYTEAYATFGVKCIVAPDVPNNAGSLANNPYHRTEGLDPECGTPGTGRGSPCDRPDAARRRVWLPAQGTGRCGARGRHIVPVESICLWRTGTGRRRPRTARRCTILYRPQLSFRRHGCRAPAKTACRQPLSRAESETCRWRSPRPCRR